MKKIFTIIIIVLAIVSFVVYISIRDKKGDESAYEQHVQSLSYFESSSGRMAYLDVGEGKPILLIHGVPTNSWMYRNIAKELVDNGYRVIVPDLIGFGASDRPNDYHTHHFEKQSQSLFELMDHLEIENWEQVTHDMGGIITWHMVKDQPEKISHLYILNTILYKETFHPPANFQYTNSFHRWLLNLHAHPHIGKMIVSNMLKTGTNDRTFSSTEKAGYWLPLRSGVMPLVHFFTHTADIKKNLDEYRSWLFDSGVSVSVLWGAHDPFLGVESVELLQNEMNIPDAEILILENASHLVAEESYLEIANFINDHE